MNSYNEKYMNKTAIKKFAVWARKKLIEDIVLSADLLGITEKGVAEPLPQSTDNIQLFDVGTDEPVKLTGQALKQRKRLVSLLKSERKEYSKAFAALIEEAAYTWFNRLIAVRFMEVNDYLPGRIRVLSSENPAKAESDIVTDPYASDIVFSEEDIKLIEELKDNNKTDELFRFLFIKQCNELNKILPELFEKTNDCTELLFNISLTDKDGILYHLVHDIPEDDFNIEKEGQVEIIGWLYQFYNHDRKNEVISLKNSTVKKQDIPAATQMFTTDWIVRFIVDNSLGRYWIERNPDSRLAEKLDYFVLPDNKKIKYINDKTDPTEIKVLDPCMGSAHFLVYSFDVLMMIYEEKGYSQRDAAVLIAEKNLFGLEIDKRAYQLSYFAIMMKVRSYNRRALKADAAISLNIACIRPSNTDKSFVNLFSVQNQKIILKLFDDFKAADELGSIIRPGITDKELNSVKAETQKILANTYVHLSDSEYQKIIKRDFIPVLKQAEILISKYDAVVTNPPFLNKMDKELKIYVNKNFKDYGADLFSVFIYRNFDFCKPNGYSGFMTPYVWMFIKAYEKLRNYIISKKNITALVQLEYSAFEEATVPVCTFVLKNAKSEEKGCYFRLSDFKGGMQVQKEKVLGAIADSKCRYFYTADADDFAKIPGSPIAYWVSENFLKIFENKNIGDYALSRNGLKTGANDVFVRSWWEVSKIQLCTDAPNSEAAVASQKKWFPYNKGGEYRKWYGNNDYVLDWENGGERVIGSAKAEKRNVQDYPDKLKFKPLTTWSLITSGMPSFRYKSSCICDIAGMSFWDVSEKDMLFYTMSLCNTKIAKLILNMIAPTINFQAGDIARIPVIIDKDKKEIVNTLVKENIQISRSEWDSFETSSDFKKHPLL